MFNNDAVNLAFDPQLGTERCRRCGAVNLYTAVPDWTSGQAWVSLVALDDCAGCPYSRAWSCPLLVADVASRW